jgi:hypothetical protein
MTEIKEVMDVRAASDYLGIFRETLYKYLSEKRIPAFKLESAVEVQEVDTGALDGGPECRIWTACTATTACR